MEPKDAGTLMLIRDSVGSNTECIEVLMLRRSANLDFAGGAFVFPGGSRSSVDVSIADDPQFFRQCELEPISLFRESNDLAINVVTSIRECFEESGILLASKSGIESASISQSPTDLLALKRHREMLLRNEISFQDILREEDLFLCAGSLFYFSRWVTPTGFAKRFDTRFFLAKAPLAQVAEHDRSETTESLWITPSAALDRAETGDFKLMLPTIKNLEALSEFSSVTQALLAVQDLEEITTVLPRRSIKGGQVTILLPGDSGYDDENMD